jgi:hypothetical protein
MNFALLASLAHQCFCLWPGIARIRGGILGEIRKIVQEGVQREKVVSLLPIHPRILQHSLELTD